MSETLTLPVLPLDDDVVLPGMVVPIELTDNEVRGAIDAARNSKGLAGGPASVPKRRPRCSSCRGSATGASRAPARSPSSSRSGGCPAASPARCCAASPG